jgi:hypothetical protein
MRHLGLIGGRGWRRATGAGDRGRIGLDEIAGRETHLQGHAEKPSESYDGDNDDDNRKDGDDPFTHPLIESEEAMKRFRCNNRATII